jgi:MFS family permease
MSFAQPSSPGAARLIDPRRHRFGAGLSVAVLALGFVLNLPLVVPLIGIALGVSAYFGTRYSILGRPWPVVRRALRLGPPAELESEVPPRFAQALGTLGLGLATIALAAGTLTGATLAIAIGWALAGAVGALQLLLAATGYCLGCQLYRLRWYVPRLFDRIVRTAA